MTTRQRQALGVALLVLVVGAIAWAVADSKRQTAEVLARLEAAPADNSARLIENAKAEVAKGQKDPTSLLFTDVRVHKAEVGTTGVEVDWVCGQVNGKNSYGAYAGVTPFTVLGSVVSTPSTYPGDWPAYWQKTCVS